jgi:hypothetical protein
MIFKGFAPPRSPLGHAAATLPQPRHHCSDIVGVKGGADPVATAALQLSGLASDYRSEGHQ